MTKTIKIKLYNTRISTFFSMDEMEGTKPIISSWSKSRRLS